MRREFRSVPFPRMPEEDVGTVLPDERAERIRDAGSRRMPLLPARSSADQDEHVFQCVGDEDPLLFLSSETGSRPPGRTGGSDRSVQNLMPSRNA